VTTLAAGGATGVDDTTTGTDFEADGGCALDSVKTHHTPPAIANAISTTVAGTTNRLGSLEIATFGIRVRSGCVTRMLLEYSACNSVEASPSNSA